MIVVELIFFLWIRSVEKIKRCYRFCSNPHSRRRPILWNGLLVA